eukprot:7117049-Ditylum_brightwellii.AAC.1
MVQIVEEYNEAVADFWTVVIDSPQQIMQHAPLDTSDGTRSADLEYLRPKLRKVATSRGIIGTSKAMSGGKTNRHIRLSTRH